MTWKPGKKSAKRHDGEPVTVKTFLTPLLYLAPFIVVVSVFMIYPMITVFLNSFLGDYNYLANTYAGMGLGILMGGFVAQYVSYQAAFCIVAAMQASGALLYAVATRWFFARRRLDL